MEQILFVVADRAVTIREAVVGAGAAILALLLGLLITAWRNSRARAAEAAGAAERQRELDDRMAEIARANAELSGRLRAMGDMFGQGQADLQRAVADRLDAVGLRVGQGLAASSQTTGEQLGRLQERLAVIDAAQARLTGLTEEVVRLKDILSNKQARGAYGQGRMEAIVRDGLPPNAYEFQARLSNDRQPDCVVRLPGDERVLVIDAKFPLEGFLALREARDEEARKAAAQRVRADFGKHVKDIAERYFLPGETQDIAILFVPSESLYADLNEHFEDVVQKAHRARVIVVSPALLMMAIQVMLAIVRDARMREQAHVIQSEVARLVEDVGRLAERTGRLEQHFRQAQEDLRQIGVSTDKIQKRGERIAAQDFETPAASAALPRAAE